MRKRTIILTIILSLLFVSVLPAAQRGIKVSAKTPLGKAIPLYSGSYALIIGNVSNPSAFIYAFVNPCEQDICGSMNGMPFISKQDLRW
jgi:hypothetical protein